MKKKDGHKRLSNQIILSYGLNSSGLFTKTMYFFTIAGFSSYSFSYFDMIVKFKKRLRKKHFIVSLTFFVPCSLMLGCGDQIQYLGETEGVKMYNGMMLSIGAPERLNKFSDRIPIAATNVSADTIYFRNMFVLASQHPIMGDIELIIFDEQGRNYPQNFSTLHYYNKLKLKSEFIVLAPGEFYKDNINLNLNDHYNLTKGNIYTVFIVYRNLLVQPTDFYPTKLAQNRTLWVGQLKSNTIKFRY